MVVFKLDGSKDLNFMVIVQGIIKDNTMKVYLKMVNTFRMG